jgi:hypothetical protein
MSASYACDLLKVISDFTMAQVTGTWTLEINNQGKSLCLSAYADSYTG